MAEQIDRFILPHTGTPPTVFTLSALPTTGTLQVYQNGILLYPSLDYSTVTNTVTLFHTSNDDLLQCVYQTGSGGVALSGSLNTAQDFIYQALRKIGAVRPGYVAGPELLTDALNEWALMADEWNSQRLMQYTQPDLTYAVTGPGSQSGGNGYTIGPVGADIIGPRPTSIIRANCVLQPTSSNPVYVGLQPLTLEEWAAKGVRKIPAIGLTTQFYYDPQFPNGVLNVFPPILAGTVLELFQFGAFAPPATLATAYAGPPGYANCIVTGLAERLYHMVDKTLVISKRPYPKVAGDHQVALNRVKKLNRPVSRLSTDFPQGGRGGYDSFVTYTGEPY